MTSLSTLFITPWRAANRSLRWTGGVFSLLLAVSGAGVGWYVGGAHGWHYGMMLYAFGAAYFWMCVMAGLLLVATDARRLRMPGVQAVVTASLLLYGAATVAMPLALFAPMGADAATIALVAMLALASGLAVAILPRYTVLFFGALPALAVSARHVVPIPFPGEPGFPVPGLGALAVLLAVCVIRWRQLLRAEGTLETGLGSAMVMQYRHNGAVGGLWGDMLLQGRTGAPRRRPDKVASVVRLDGVGPWSPVLALRVALGENDAPQTLRGRWRRFVRVGLPLLLFVLLMAVMGAGDARGDVLQAVLRGVGLGVAGWLGVAGGLTLMLLGSLSPGARWRRTGAELSLLALLPGLGDGAACRRHLLHAALGRPLKLQVVLLMLVLAAVLAMHGGPWLLLFVTLAQLGCLAALVALVLDVFGGSPLPACGEATVLTGVGLLVAVSTFVPMVAALAHHPQPLTAGTRAALIVAWAATAGVLLWLGRRGWAGMKRRPHPFLVG